MKNFIYIVLAGMVLASCSPRIHTRTELVWRDKVVRDSLYFRDSIYLKEWIKGDTVYQDKYVYKYVYKDKLKTDTVIVEKHDTIFVQVPVEKKLSKVEQAKQDLFGWLALILTGLLIWTFRKPLLALLKR